ncbi:MAG TPA: major capsid protein [Candidatus Limnocylindrales bacterium]|nr:major capsid protein [Candidatus Limnocylindrales bacterium]
MAKTQLADIIVPAVFAPYILQRTAEKSDLFQSGIVESNPDYNDRAAQGGTQVNMPHWNDLTGNRQPLSDSAPLVPAKLTADQDIARIQNDGNAWSWNHLASVTAGDDPAGALANFLADYWNRQNQYMVISSLKGMFAASSMSGNLLAIHSESVTAQTLATRLNGATFVDATQRLGDRGDRLVAVAMHSATEAALRKLDLIDFIPDSQGESQIRTFQGRRVIVDDGCPSRTGTTDGQVYTTYLFGNGAFGIGNADLNGQPVEGGHGTEGFEYARDALNSDTIFVNRRRFILHPRGVKFTSASVAGANPTNAELEIATNWTRVWENKNVRVVAVTHNL